MTTNEALTLELETDVLTALDRFIQEQARPPTREQAFKMILLDALVGYGIAPLDAPPPANPKDAH